MSALTARPSHLSRRLLVIAAVSMAAVGGVAVGVGGLAAGAVAVAILAATVASIWFPGVLYAAFLLLPLYKGAVQGYSPIDLTVVLSILNILQFIPIVAGPKVRPSYAAICLWVAMSLMILGGVLYARDQDLALDHALRWWSLAFLPILAGSIRVGSDPRYVRQLLWTFFGAGVVTVLLGLSQLSQLQRLTILNANTIQVSRAALLVPLVGLTFVVYQRVSLVTFAMIALIPISLIVAVASGSRGPLLFLLVLALFGTARYLLGPNESKSRSIRLAGIVVAATVVAALLVAPELPGASLARFGLLGDFVGNEAGGGSIVTTGDQSASTRVTLYGLAASMFAERPLLGYGTGGFEVMSLRRLPVAEAEAWPHNAVLQAAAEFGLVGLILFGAFLVLVMVRGHKGTTDAALLALLAFFLLNAMVSGDIFSDRQTWGLVMLVLMVRSSATHRRSAPSDAKVEPMIPTATGAYA